MANRISQRAQTALEREERAQARVDFHQRIQQHGDLAGVLASIRDDVDAGSLSEAAAITLAEEAILMSRPLYPFGAGRKALDALGDRNPDAAREAELQIALIHREIRGPDGTPDAHLLTEAQLDPLRYLANEIDPELRDQVAASDDPSIAICVRTQMAALADHLQRCNYMSAQIVANWMMARLRGQSPQTTMEIVRNMADELERTIQPLAFDPAGATSLRDALNERIQLTRKSDRRRKAGPTRTANV